MISTPCSAAVRLVESALLVPTATEAEAAEVVVAMLLENPDVLHALASTTGRAVLSRREAEIAALVAQGLPNKAIAEQLGISAFTVSSYLRRVFVKLGVTTRAQMVAVMMRRGLLPAPSEVGEP